MKTLQNNFTTPEQSKRLLELGVPADSADLYYQDYGSIPMIVWTLTQPRDLRRGILKPCWSVGRLIEIMTICSKETNTSYVFRRTDGLTIISNIIRCIQLEVDCGRLDFSKLEEYGTKKN